MPVNDRFSFTFGRSSTSPSRRLDGRESKRILLLGDFSGRHVSSSVPTGLTTSAPLQVDVDNFDRVMSRLRPKCLVTSDVVGLSSTEIEFASLEDFHPDALFKHIAAFESLRNLRTRLLDPKTFAQAAKELGWTPRTFVDASAMNVADESDRDTLARLLGMGSRDASYMANTADAVSALVKRIVEPHIKPCADAHLQRYLEVLDESISVLMRAVLHNSEFQAIEAAWRAVYQIITAIDDDAAVQIHLLDVTKDELCQDLNATSKDLSASMLYEALSGENAEWSLVIGNYTFGLDDSDIDLLAALGTISSAVGGIFLTATPRDLVGYDTRVPASLPQTNLTIKSNPGWQSLRQSDAACHIGLVWPRLMLRLPYGRRTETIDAFKFEEIVDPEMEHEAFLWGSPGFGLAELAAMVWSQGQTLHDEYAASVLASRPTYTYQKDGEWQAVPAAEVYLTDNAAEQLQLCGIIPVLSHRTSDTVKFTQLISIADPPTRLTLL